MVCFDFLEGFGLVNFECEFFGVVVYWGWLVWGFFFYCLIDMFLKLVYWGNIGDFLVGVLRCWDGFVYF